MREADDLVRGMAERAAGCGKWVHAVLDLGTCLLPLLFTDVDSVGGGSGHGIGLRGRNPQPPDNGPADDGQNGQAGNSRRKGGLAPGLVLRLSNDRKSDPEPPQGR